MSNLPWILSSLVLFSFPVPARTLQAGACTGCLGGGASATASGGTCGGTVSISVEASNGECKWFKEDEPLLFECQQLTGCATTITRTWSGLPTGSIVEFCVDIGVDVLCLQKKTIVDADGSGTSVRSGPFLSCSGTSDMTFQVESEACGLMAEATPTCSECVGDI